MTRQRLAWIVVALIVISLVLILVLDPLWAFFLIAVLWLFAGVEYVGDTHYGGTLSEKFWAALVLHPWLRWVVVVAFGSLAVWAIGHLGWRAW